MNKQGIVKEFLRSKFSSLNFEPAFGELSLGLKERFDQQSDGFDEEQR